jgi:glycosyltransferase involved in cell wall biosynthesis
MAGPGIRYLNFARVLSGHYKTALFAPNKCDIKDSGFPIIDYRQSLKRIINQYLNAKSVVIAPGLPPSIISRIRKIGARYIADLYDLNLIEVLEYAKDEPGEKQVSSFKLNRQTLVKELLTSDHILCSNQRQRDFYLGLLSSLGRLNPGTYDLDPDFSNFISLVPFGMESSGPKTRTKNIYHKKFPAIAPTDKIIYWGGGIWNWFDPLSVIKAVEVIAKNRNDIKLFFLGVKHPNPKIKEMKAANEAIAYAKKHGLEGKSVFFNYGWTGFEERVDFLAQADIGISTHFDNLETHFSMRTRILDYLWAQLPIITTRGDYSAGLVDDHNLGISVPPQNPQKIADAILAILDNNKLRKEIKNNVAKIKPRFYWEKVLDPLIVKIIDDSFSSPQIGNYGISVISLKYYLAKLHKYIGEHYH